ncbi:DUF748 domain-containing protein [Dyella terrae]|nr:DUF748 domain-containing protein [Dyella terrae]
MPKNFRIPSAVTTTEQQRMADPTSPGRLRLEAARQRALATYHSHRVRKTLLILAIVLVLFGLLGFFAGPSIIKSQIEKRATVALGRPVTLDKVHLNPYTLRLQLDQLHIGDRDGKAAFVDIDQVVVNTSWSSVYRLAPVLDELTLQRPRVRIVREADQRFNFTDLIDKFASGPTDPNAKPARFALSNISIHDGDIDFDDQAGKATHKVEQIELGIPFLANLPSSTDIYVQPLLAMRVDGSPVSIKGQTKPFAESRDSTMDFQLDKLDLARYMGYVPTPLPIAIPKGLLSGTLVLHFLEAKPTPTLQLTGNLHLDDFALNSSKGQAIASINQGDAQLSDVQPLASRYVLGTLKLDGAQVHYTQGPGGSSNFDTMLQKSAAPADAKPETPTDVRIAAVELANGAIHYTDANAQKLDITQLRGSIQALSLLKAAPAKIHLDGQMFGGQIGAQGTIDLSNTKLASTLTLKQVDLPPLQAVAAPPFAARVHEGKLDASGPMQLNWGKDFNVILGPATAAVTGFALEPQFKGHGAPVAWSKMEAQITKVDLASREARLGIVTATDMKLDVQRNSNKYISIVDLFAAKTDVKQARKEAAKKTGEVSPAWHWSIDKLALANGSVLFSDLAAGTEPAKIQLDSLDGGIERLSDNFAQPRDVKLEGKAGRGTFSMNGKVQPLPSVADLQVTFRQFDIANYAPYISVPLNVVISQARISGSGKLHYDGRRADPVFTYNGNASLDRVRVQDKVTGDDFLRWNTLNASRLDVSYGVGAPRMHVGMLTLSSFYARMIVNADGRLNLSDVVQKEQNAPVSVTRAEPTTPQPKAPVVTPKQPQQATVEATGPAADIQIGGVTLLNGQLNYTDNFIKPNYTANLTQVTGKIGAFGTQEGGPPADLAVQAALDEDSPVDINGTINPLAPVAALDIKGKADEVELTHLSAYSSKYTGYPITQGKLTVDVHYVLDHSKLNADNHIFITQLTFGDRIEGTGVSHLPVKLAVALLKDTQGNIDVDVPVSGSLDDPQFSMGGLIWRAIGNLIAKAATAPFRLLGAAFGGKDHEELGYVEFDPGSAVLDDQATQRMEKIVNVLKQKPSLTLDIIGRVDPDKDQKGLRKVTVDNLVRKEKQLDDKGKDADTSDVALAKVEITPDQYERFLKRAYKHSEIDKPKNAIGLNKSLEPDEMRSLMETNVSVDDKAMRDLATRRAQAVREWFKGKIDDNRVGVKDVKLTPEGIDDKGKTTRVDFGLH